MRFKERLYTQGKIGIVKMSLSKQITYIMLVKKAHLIIQLLFTFKIGVLKVNCMSQQYNFFQRLSFKNILYVNITKYISTFISTWLNYDAIYGSNVYEFIMFIQ